MSGSGPLGRNDRAGWGAGGAVVLYVAPVAGKPVSLLRRIECGANREFGHHGVDRVVCDAIWRGLPVVGVAYR